MPRFLVQTESGSWYQVDTEQPAAMRWSSRAILGEGDRLVHDPSKWIDLDVHRVLMVQGKMPLILLCKDGMTITTTPLISRTIIENLSKRRAVPA